MTNTPSLPLSAAAIIEIWEHGAGRHPIDRSLLVLLYTCPGGTTEALSRWPIGKRDRRLLEIRRNTFGDCIRAYAECPACQNGVAFDLSCERILARGRLPNPDHKTVTRGGMRWELRLPDSRDLAAAALLADLPAARAALLDRCVRPVDETIQDSGHRADGLEAALADDLAALDPLTEIWIDLTCRSCGHGWQSLFDIAAFLWREIRARARRLLQEVDLLARTYGWTEGDILDLGDRRRNFYVQMALS